MLKESAFRELVDAIRVVASNKTYISPAIAGIVTENYLQHLSEVDTQVSSILTSREVEVLQLLVEGKSTKQAALRLRISAKTIESHRQRIMKKLDINNIADLTRFAVREGIISL